MRIVACPQCGHENRAAIVVTICDRCGEDISTFQKIEPVVSFDDRDQVSVVAEPVETQDRLPAGKQTEATGGTRDRPSRSWVWSMAARALIGGGALYAGIQMSLRAPLGSALGGDESMAGSVAILAAATAVAGFVMLLVPGGSTRSTGVTAGLRALGVALALVGVWAASTIATQGLTGRPSAVTMPVPAGPMGPGSEGMPEGVYGPDGSGMGPMPGGAMPPGDGMGGPPMGPGPMGPGGMGPGPTSPEPPEG